ncbi:MAG TPA: hypothetical protein VFX30_07415 [bacterium]|nr:hypothetical protein [bacterium]
MGGDEISVGYAGPAIPCDVEARLVGDMLTLIQNSGGGGRAPDMGAITTLYSVEHPDLPSELGITRDDAVDLIDGLYARAFEMAVSRGLIARTDGMTMPPVARLFCPGTSSAFGPTGTGFASVSIEANPPQITILVGDRRVPAYVGALPPGSMPPLTHMALPEYDYAGRAVYVPITELQTVIHSEGFVMGDLDVEGGPSASPDRAVAEMNRLLDRTVRTAVGTDGAVAGPRPRIEYDIVDGHIRNVHVTEFRITRDGRPIDPSAAREIEAALEGREIPREAFGWEGHHVH